MEFKYILEIFYILCILKTREVYDMQNEEKTYKISMINKYDEKISEKKRGIIINTCQMGVMALAGYLTADKSSFESFVMGVLPISIMSMPFLLQMVSSIGAKTAYENEKKDLEQDFDYMSRGRSL